MAFTRPQPHVLLSVLLAGAAHQHAAAAPASPHAASGASEVVVVCPSSDCTAALQAALFSNAHHVLVKPPVGGGPATIGSATASTRLVVHSHGATAAHTLNLEHMQSAAICVFPASRPAPPVTPTITGHHATTPACLRTSGQRHEHAHRVRAGARAPRLPEQHLLPKHRRGTSQARGAVILLHPSHSLVRVSTGDEHRDLRQLQQILIAPGTLTRLSF